MNMNKNEEVLKVIQEEDLKEGETMWDKALSITKDPEKIRQLLGLQRVSEVLSTLNALAIRKEYHSSLIRNGVEFDYLIRGIKNIADDSTEKGATRLKAFLSLLKSLGVDKFDIPSGSSGTGWEDELMKRLEGEKKEPELLELESGEVEENITVHDPIVEIPTYDPAALYKVVEPKMPERIVDQKKREDLISGSNK
jgi:hypothetical protein